jgi:hypothetical protein
MLGSYAICSFQAKSSFEKGMSMRIFPSSSIALMCSILATPLLAAPNGPANRIPAQFQGEWNITASDCGDFNSAGSLVIYDNRVTYPRNIGDISRVTINSASSITVKALYSGSMDFESVTDIMTLSNGGKSLNVSGKIYQRCEK